MPGKKTQILMTAVLLVALLSLTSCSFAPSGPQPGTPAFYWQAAKQTFSARDYIKTADHLSRVAKTDNEFTLRAVNWQLVLSAGLSKAYIDLAEEFEKGAKANTVKPMLLRRPMSSYRALAEQRAMEFGQAFVQFEKILKEQNVVLEFPFPAADTAEIQELKQIESGSVLSEANMGAVERRMIGRSIAQAACAAVGAAGDTAKAQTLFQAGSAQAPRDVFVLAMANNLYDLARLFGRTKLDKGDRLELLSNEALDALKTFKENKQTKDLTAKFQKLLKDAKAPR